MTHHTCTDCQMGFIAKSYDEAMEELQALPKEERDRAEIPAYAKQCPYCGSTAIKAI